jgi:hypothetical protein
LVATVTALLFIPLNDSLLRKARWESEKAYMKLNKAIEEVEVSKYKHIGQSVSAQSLRVFYTVCAFCLVDNDCLA